MRYIILMVVTVLFIFGFIWLTSKPDQPEQESMNVQPHNTRVAVNDSFILIGNYVIPNDSLSTMKITELCRCYLMMGFVIGTYQDELSQERMDRVLRKNLPKRFKINKHGYN